MQQLNEDRIASTRSFWEKLLQLEHDLLARNQQLVGSAMTVVHAVAPKADVELFAGNNRIEQAVPHDFVFEPSLLWKDSVS